MNFADASLKLENWIKYNALPLWDKAGIDSNSGGHFEQLDSDGEPNKIATLRLRVQSRQIFVHSFAHYLGWSSKLSNAGENTEALIKFLHRKTVGTHYPHLLNSDFDVIDYRQDLYDYAFHILAYTWVYRAYGHKAALDHAIKLYEHIDLNFKSAHGGWHEGNYRPDFRRQNPHMHMLEALITLYEATNKPVWLDRAAHIVELFETVFFDSDCNMLLEFFRDDWSQGQNEVYRQVEPGHMMEWVWLLGKYGEYAQQDYAHYMLALYKSARDHGMCKDGLLYDQIDVSGNVLASTKRCWPITEGIKASIALARIGHREHAASAASLIENLFKHYITSPANGAYIDQLDEDNRVIKSVTSASTMYHLIVAAGESSALRLSYNDHACDKKHSGSGNPICNRLQYI